MKSARTLVLEYYENKGHDISREDIRTTRNPRMAIYDGKEYWVSKRKPYKMTEKNGPYGMSPRMLVIFEDGNCLWRV